MTKNLADDLQRTARQAMTGITPSPQGEEVGGLPFRRLLAAMFRARYLVFATTLFGILIGTFLALTTPNSYVSEGKFLFTASGAEAREVGPTRTTDTSQETIGTAATYILNSHDLMMKVVERLTPARILEPYQPGTGDDSGARGLFFRIQRDYNATKAEDATAEEALKHLLRTVKIDRPRGTDVLLATCVANNPVLAQEILAAFMDEAVKWHIKIYDDESVYAEAEKRHEDTRVALDKARSNMRDFLERKARVPDFDNEKERLLFAEMKASELLQTVTNDAATKKEQLQKLSQRLANKEIEEEKVENRPIDTTSAAVRILDEQYARAIIDLNNLLRVRNEGDDQIVEKRAQISDISKSIAQLREAGRNAPFESVKIPNPEFTQANTLRMQLSLDYANAEVALALAKQIATEARTNLKALLDLEPEFAKLRDEQHLAEDNAKTSTSLWNAAQEKKALSIGKFSSLKEMQTATLPLEKEGPNRGKLLLGAFFVGLFFGLGVVILRALPDNVVRTRDDLEKIEGLAVIGVMPRLDGGNLRRHVSLREQGW